jgi:hypothetical protein
MYLLILDLVARMPRSRLGLWQIDILMITATLVRVGIPWIRFYCCRNIVLTDCLVSEVACGNGDFLVEFINARIERCSNGYGWLEKVRAYASELWMTKSMAKG